MAPTILTSTSSVNSVLASGGGYGTFGSSEDLLQESDKLYPGIRNPTFKTEKGEESRILPTSTGDSTEPQNEEAKVGFKYKYGGMALAFLASMLISCTTLIVKVLHTNYDTNAEDASFARWAGITLPTIPILIYYERCSSESKERSVFDTVWPVKEHWMTALGLLIRGILGCSTVILRYFALRYLTIGDTSVISYSSPILVTILAHFLLGEKTGIIPVMSAVMTLCGVVVITQPPILTGNDSFDDATLIGTGFACGSLVSSAMMTILTRKIRQVQFSLMLLVIGSIGMLQSYIVAVIRGPGLSLPKESTDLLLLMGIAVLSFVGQMAVILALKIEQAGPVALVRTCDVVFGFLFQFIFLGVTPNVFSAIGGSIIFGAILLMAMRKYLSTLPLNHRIRRLFRILLY